MEPAEQELRRLAESTRALAAAASPDAVIDLLWQQLASWYPTCECALALYPEDSGNPKVIHTSGSGASHAIEQNTRESGGASAAISEPQGTVLDGSLLVLGRRHGLVAVVSAGPRFTPHDIDVLDIVLSAAANALANLEQRGPDGEATWGLTVDAVSLILILFSLTGVYLWYVADRDWLGFMLLFAGAAFVSGTVAFFV